MQHHNAAGHADGVRSRALSSVGSCSSDVAAIVVGEFRNFSAPIRRENQRWRELTAETAWRGLQQALVVSNGPADLFVHAWESELARNLVDHTIVPVCAAVCEAYGDAYMERIIANYSGFRKIGGNLRLRDRRETPHLIDFFYKRYAALLLLRRVEERRRRPYLAVVMSRPDVVIDPPAVPVRPSELLQSTVYMHNTDHHPDSTDTDSNTDPMARGLCGQTPNDWVRQGEASNPGLIPVCSPCLVAIARSNLWVALGDCALGKQFAFGDRRSMGMYMDAFPSLPSLSTRIRTVKGSCDWWKCHNYRYNQWASRERTRRAGRKAARNLPLILPAPACLSSRTFEPCGGKHLPHQRRVVSRLPPAGGGPRLPRCCAHEPAHCHLATRHAQTGLEQLSSQGPTASKVKWFCTLSRLLYRHELRVESEPAAGGSGALDGSLRGVHGAAVLQRWIAGDTELRKCMYGRDPSLVAAISLIFACR